MQWERRAAERYSSLSRSADKQTERGRPFMLCAPDKEAVGRTRGEQRYLWESSALPRSPHHDSQWSWPLPPPLAARTHAHTYTHNWVPDTRMHLLYMRAQLHKQTSEHVTPNIHSTVHVHTVQNNMHMHYWSSTLVYLWSFLYYCKYHYTWKYSSWIKITKSNLNNISDHTFMTIYRSESYWQRKYTDFQMLQ